MDSVGPRELEQNASELVRRGPDQEAFWSTVAARTAATGTHLNDDVILTARDADRR